MPSVGRSSVKDASIIKRYEDMTLKERVHLFLSKNADLVEALATDDITKLGPINNSFHQKTSDKLRLSEARDSYDSAVKMRAIVGPNIFDRISRP